MEYLSWIINFFSSVYSLFWNWKIEFFLVVTGSGKSINIYKIWQFVNDKKAVRINWFVVGLKGLKPNSTIAVVIK